MVFQARPLFFFPLFFLLFFLFSSFSEAGEGIVGIPAVVVFANTSFHSVQSILLFNPTNHTLPFLLEPPSPYLIISPQKGSIAPFHYFQINLTLNISSLPEYVTKLRVPLSIKTPFATLVIRVIVVNNELLTLSPLTLHHDGPKNPNIFNTPLPFLFFFFVGGSLLFLKHSKRNCSY